MRESCESPLWIINWMKYYHISSVALEDSDGSSFKKISKLENQKIKVELNAF